MVGKLQLIGSSFRRISSSGLRLIWKDVSGSMMEVFLCSFVPVIA